MYAIPLAYASVMKNERTSDLDRFVRWEYGPADRTQVLLSARGGVVLFPRRTAEKPSPSKRGILRGLLSALRGRASATSVDG